MKIKKVNSLYILLLLLIFIFLLAACSHRENPSEPPKAKTIPSLFDQAKPLTLKQDTFQKIVGWLDNTSIVYMAEENNQSIICKYNLLDGNQSILFSSGNPIKNVVISPDKKNLLIHSASLTYSAALSIIDTEGKIIVNRKVPSYDLSFHWNRENPDLILTTVFYEDWSYRVNILNVKDGSFHPYDFNDPFVKWFRENDIVLQNWKDNEMHFFAPLWSYSSPYTNKGRELFQNIYQFDSFQPYLMTITIPEKDRESAMYHFYNDTLEEMFSFRVPHLRQYDNWLVPYYDFSHHEFLTFVPHGNGSADEYNGNFQLVRYDIQEKDKTIIADSLKNEPILFSPDRTLCLYGYQLNQLIDLKTGKKKKIVEYEKKSQ
ncbi:hypothetical protein [Bacillus sp. FJAT-49736]|uniref:YqgU-like beta propeller domain-containing protein n=1 Tax=Bacillus sp. FJAT-49736 TaxID=2833582 RepID=UPI001BCA1982|nr:hypothetical protein [Bacillus sp. FJAT-49736]MBS4173533.1 hypothetical protein [Bacillus sp. FJAT-49736]